MQKSTDKNAERIHQVNTLNLEELFGLLGIGLKMQSGTLKYYP